MNEAVFISDLHLHPDDKNIQNRFNQFISWAQNKTKSIYILGDFVHVWPGDEALDFWANSIIKQLNSLADLGIKLYFMPGNRDFLMGSSFLNKAHMQYLPDPTPISIGETIVLLSHGDRYCTRDKSHQWLRRLTRNDIF